MRMSRHILRRKISTHAGWLITRDIFERISESLVGQNGQNKDDEGAHISSLRFMNLEYCNSKTKASASISVLNGWIEKSRSKFPTAKSREEGQFARTPD